MKNSSQNNVNARLIVSQEEKNRVGANPAFLNTRRFGSVRKIDLRPFGSKGFDVLMININFELICLLVFMVVFHRMLK